MNVGLLLAFLVFAPPADAPRAAASEYVIPAATQARIERWSVPGAVGGFVLGAAAGAALGCAANRDSYGVFCGGQNDTKVVAGAVAGGLAGAALGGWLFRSR